MNCVNFKMQPEVVAYFGKRLIQDNCGKFVDECRSYVKIVQTENGLLVIPDTLSWMITPRGGVN